MIEGLPRYIATRLGGLPDAYLLEGARVTSLTRVEGPAEGAPSAAFPQMPDGLAAIDEIANTIAMVERVHGSVSDRLIVGTDAPAAMEPRREEALVQMVLREQHRRGTSVP